jgi:SAM-dependent methyltransferase
MKLRIVPMNPVRWVLRSLQTKGLAQTVKVAWSFLADLSFDWKYGTDTIRRVEMSSLVIYSENKVNACRYGATKTQPFVELIRRLVAPTDSVFVDIGCGKGKVLLLAALCGFRRIIGIDFSPDLCRIARTNISIFQKKRPLHSSIKIIECDAAHYQFGPEESIFFTFDPFNAAVLDQVLNNLRLSIQETPRKIWFIYHSPEHYRTIEQAQVFKSCQDFNITGTRFKVYLN